MQSDKTEREKIKRVLKFIEKKVRVKITIKACVMYDNGGGRLAILNNSM